MYIFAINNRDPLYPLPIFFFGNILTNYNTVSHPGFDIDTVKTQNISITVKRSLYLFIATPTPLPPHHALSLP